jgi:hypothetical protein
MLFLKCKIPTMKKRILKHQNSRPDPHDELKLIKFDNRSKGLSWNAFYQGIGQALLGLKHGVHRYVVLVGFHENILDDKFLDEFHEMLWKGRENLYSQILGSYISIGTYFYKGGSINCEIEAKYDFNPSNDSTNLSRQNLLNRNFTYNKRLRKSEL